MPQQKKFRVILPIPPSVNHAYVRTKFGMALTKEAKAWKEAAYKSAKKQLEGWQCQDERTIVDIWIYWANKRRRDSDNILKLGLDSLKHAVYTDDKWALPRIQNFGYDKSNPRIEIEVRRFEEEDVCS